MNTRAILRRSRKNFQTKKSFIVGWQIKKISDKEYKHVLKTWNTFQMKTMKDYHDFRLKRDVLLLSDVSERF